MKSRNHIVFLIKTLMFLASAFVFSNHNSHAQTVGQNKAHAEQRHSIERTCLLSLASSNLLGKSIEYISVHVPFNDIVQKVELATIANQAFKSAVQSGFSGVPVIAMPELDGSMDSHGKVLEYVNSENKELPILQLDLIGQGNTYDKNGPILSKHLPVDSQVEALRQLLDFYGIEKAHLVGFSYSGGVAQAFAFKYPNRIKEITLFAPYTKPLERMLRYEIEDLYVRLSHRILLKDRQWPEIRRRTLGRMVKGMFEYNFIELAKQYKDNSRIRFQVNIIYATKDNVTPNNDHQQLAEAYKLGVSPNIQVITMEDIGHRIPREAPEASAAGLMQFITD